MLCIIMLISLTACGDGGYKRDMSFTYILPGSVSSLDPQTTWDNSAAAIVISSIFEGLCRTDEDGRPLPGVAKSWESNGDSTQFTFHLRTKAQWSNGAEVTADDFLFALQRALRPETTTYSVDDLFIIKGARAIHAGEAEEDTLGVQVADEHTLVIQLEKSYPDFPALTSGTHFMPCNRSYFEESAGHYALSSSDMITNGPFTFSSSYSWNTDSGKRAIGLTRFEGYKGEQNVLASDISFLIDYDSSIDEAPLQALSDGLVDILKLPGSMVEDASQQGYGVISVQDAVTGLLLNPESPQLENNKVRELFIKTLDRRELLMRRTEQSSGEASGIMPDCVHWNGESYYADQAAVYAEQDDSLAEGPALTSLLSSLKLEQVPSITVICKDDEESISIANGFLVSWNSKLSNAFNIQPLSESEFQSRILSGDYQAALYTLQAGGSSPYSVLKAFDSSSSPTLLNSEEFDNALHTISFDLPSFRQLETQLMESYVFYPIFSDKTYYATNPNTRDITVSPDTGVDFTSARKKE